MPFPDQISVVLSVCGGNLFTERRGFSNKGCTGDDWRWLHMAETYKGDAYCVKCKEKREFEGTVKVSDSGRRMAQGICPVCGTKVNRILGKAQ